MCELRPEERFPASLGCPGSRQLGFLGQAQSEPDSVLIPALTRGDCTTGQSADAPWPSASPLKRGAVCWHAADFCWRADRPELGGQEGGPPGCGLQSGSKEGLVGGRAKSTEHCLLQNRRSSHSQVPRLRL